MNKLILTAVLFFVVVSNLAAQKITDGGSVDVNGLTVTFNIVNKETVSIGGQSFDRCKVAATLVNNSGKSFNLRLSSYPQLTAKPELIELDCINATGAKMTSKRLKLKMNTHYVRATYTSFSKDGQLQNNFLNVTAGYYLDNGETVKDEGIFIVPQGQLPDVTIRKVM
jgi:hypothetical protein